MIAGFAVIAWPADDYGKTGVMTFIVNQRGDVYEKDIGADTAKRAQAIRIFVRLLRSADQTRKRCLHTRVGKKADMTAP